MDCLDISTEENRLREIHDEFGALIHKKLKSPVIAFLSGECYLADQSVAVPWTDTRVVLRYIAFPRVGRGLRQVAPRPFIYPESKSVVVDAAEAIASDIEEIAGGKRIISARLPTVLPGTGAVSIHGCTVGGLMYRTIAAFDLRAFAFEISFDVLCGVG